MLDPDFSSTDPLCSEYQENQQFRILWVVFMKLTVFTIDVEAADHTLWCYLFWRKFRLPFHVPCGNHFASCHRRYEHPIHYAVGLQNVWMCGLLNLSSLRLFVGYLKETVYHNNPHTLQELTNNSELWQISRPTHWTECSLYVRLGEFVYLREWWTFSASSIKPILLHRMIFNLIFPVGFVHHFHGINF